MRTGAQNVERTTNSRFIQVTILIMVPGTTLIHACIAKPRCSYPSRPFSSHGLCSLFPSLVSSEGCDSHQWYDLRTRGNRSTLLVSWRCILGQPPHEVVRFQFVTKRSICSNLKGTSTQAPMPTDLLRVRVLRRLGGAILDFV